PFSPLSGVPVSALGYFRHASHFTSSPDIFINLNSFTQLLKIFWHSGSDFTSKVLFVKPCSALGYFNVSPVANACKTFCNAPLASLKVPFQNLFAYRIRSCLSCF
ncbi:MAG: hypothetical protein ACRC6H_05645, partial [Culicoidibacterales bacterium]